MSDDLHTWGDDSTATRLLDEPPGNLPDDEVDAPDLTPPMIEDFTVDYAGHRTFTIEEPDIYAITKLLNIIGAWGLRAERTQGQYLKGLFAFTPEGSDGKKEKTQFVPPPEAIMFALAAVMEPRDFQNIGVVVLFGGRPSQFDEGTTFFKELGEAHLKLAPIIKAFALRMAQSEDLVAALGNLPLFRAAIEVWSSKAAKATTRRALSA